ncbi:glycoside hydrolase family 130 protein [Arthrobacter sp. UYEF3]|uniref:glycoside hydrolase family 130 protein n=1 Tax=Arthrobacter sp. UYEF3 TaxID=1756365 RepID=UPI00339971E3
MSSAIRQLIARAEVRLDPDPSRVLAQLFVPGQELVRDRRSRTSGVLSRILALPEEAVDTTLEAVTARFTGRHRDLRAILQAHYERVAHRVTDATALSNERRLLIGACFTKEYSVEAAALFNPSAVAHPDQSGLERGAVRFVLSLRAVGEGHISSLEFRTGVVGPGRNLRLDDPGRFLDAGHHQPTTYERELFLGKLLEAAADEESSSFLRRRLPSHFDNAALESALSALAGQPETWHGAARTGHLARHIATCNYDIEFDATSPLPERVLWPHAPSESGGIEDARFVRFIDDDGSATYYATYTAFDGKHVAPQLIETADFQRFQIRQLSGPAARNKGMALFPRKVGGRFIALSRWDRESSAIATSPDGRAWGSPTTLQTPEQPWELIQLGNAGSPVETDSGWLVLTHGVGPMHEYSLGAILLDLHDPSRVIGALREPLIRPAPSERDGYVPNVVYSCGALVCGEQLLLPYGVSDSSVRFAFVDIPLLLDRLTVDGPWK